MKSVGKPDAANPHVRLDERGRETERLAQPQAAAPFLDFTNRNVKGDQNAALRGPGGRRAGVVNSGFPSPSRQDTIIFEDNVAAVPTFAAVRRKQGTRQLPRLSPNGVGTIGRLKKPGTSDLKQDARPSQRWKKFCSLAFPYWTTGSYGSSIIWAMTRQSCRLRGFRMEEGHEKSARIAG